ncbi:MULTISPECIES: NAD(+) diphosphatase [unclassified Arthrobacter]|uniref:NAD(+) diphosphatase n=1 Tax=unclassified Arthrobacter TaxID=235627 RepID=UPI002DFE2B1E|nr:NAD+ diphosphatase [Arthrobacter sp. MP_M4]MEC5204341.1 NAD+ diphosphatase [Arthrobacter sp. MP_M7]
MSPGNRPRGVGSATPQAGPAAGLLEDTVLPVRSTLIDRGSAARVKPGMLAELLSSGSARAMVLSGRQALINGSNLVLLDAAELAKHLQGTAYAPDHVIYLGSALPGADLPAGTQLVLFLLPQQFEVRAEEFEAHVAGIPEGAQWAGFRDVAAALSPTDTALFVEASAIANWHATHIHCPRCGSATVPEAGGWVRRCPADGSEHYPRTDPAIIVTVVGPDGRLLLGGGGPLDARNFSTLAGFVEPGETLEQAVVREIGEEVGVKVTACQYLGSQPWPFPASLMLGFTATTADSTATPDGIEVTRARWFSRSELQEAVLSGEIVISSRLSIARALIEHWYGGIIHDRVGGV